MISTFYKSVTGTLDYYFDWSSWLDSTAGETITTATVTADTGITKDSDAIVSANQKVQVWLSGGTDETDYFVTCTIVTSESRTDTRRMKIKVRLRPVK